VTGRAPAGDAPLVTIIITTFNRWPMVADAVESALAQERSAVEVIVVDDGSTDGTAERLRERYPGVSVISQANAERGAARNHGAAAAHGRYLGFLDSDDVLEPWHVRQLEDLLTARGARSLPPPRAASAPVRMWSPDTRSCWTAPRPPRFHRGLPLQEATLVGTVLMLPGLFVEAPLFEAACGFPVDRRLAINEDWVFLARLAARAEILPLQRPSVRVRDHPKRSIGDPEQACRSRLCAMELMLREGLLGRPLDSRQHALVTAGAHHFCAAMSYEGRDMRATREHLRHAAAAISPREGVVLCARLWLQSWTGPRAASLARGARDALRVRVRVK
jgi:glycosyltransferase involved in cell wall biosynthesis